MKNDRGYITVFLSLILCVMMIVVTAVLTIADYKHGSTKAEAALSSAESDTLARYQKMCFDRYHLLICDITDGGCGEGASEERIMKLMQENLGDSFDVQEIALSGMEKFAANDYESFKHQIKDNSGYEAAGFAVDKIKEKTSDNDEPLNHGDIQNMENDIDNEKETRELEQMEKAEQGNLQTSESDKRKISDVNIKADDYKYGIVKTNESDGAAEYKKNDIEDPRDVLKSIKSAGIPDLIKPKNIRFSPDSIKGEDLPSDKVNQNHFKDVDTEFDDYDSMKKDLTSKNGWGNALSDHAEAIAYAADSFNCLTDQKYDDTYLNMELEYLACGEKTDSENYAMAVRGIIAIRLGINFSYLITDVKKMAELDSISLAICSAAPFSQPVVKYLLAGCWSYCESISDAYYLVHGKNLPYLKTEETWMTDLEHLGEIGNSDIKENENGMSYKDYLMILVSLHPKMIYPRMLDLIQLNVRKKGTEGGDEKFLIKNAVTAFGIDAEIKYKKKKIYLHEETGY